MFEASLISIMRGDTLLGAYVSDYAGGSAIFSDSAPEDCDLPYATVLIDETTAGDSIVSSFLITIEFFEQAESSAKARNFIKRAIDLLDRRIIKGDAEYDTIRLFFSNARRIDEGDPRDVHYQLEFTARAGRKRFCESITTEGE